VRRGRDDEPGSTYGTRPPGTRSEPDDAPRGGVVEHEAHDIRDPHVPEGSARRHDHNGALAIGSASPFVDAASSIPAKNRITPKDRHGEQAEQGAYRVREEQCRRQRQRPDNHESAARPCAETNVPSHAACAPAHRHSTKRGRDEIHHGMDEGEQSNAHPPVREEVVMLFGGSDYGVVERQRGLGTASARTPVSASPQVIELPLDLPLRDRV
jgi:hypothetical protein